MKTYESLKEIELDLKKINLERQIAIEELKIAKHELENGFKPINLFGSFLKMASKYGFLLLFKRLFK